MIHISYSEIVISLVYVLMGIHLFIAFFTSEKQWYVYFQKISVLIFTILMGMGLCLRWIESGHAPFSNMYESMLLFVFSVILVQMFLYLKNDRFCKAIDLNVFLLVFLGYALALPPVSWLINMGNLITGKLFSRNWIVYPDKLPERLNPILDTIWFQIHVPLFFIGFSFLAVGSFLSYRYLINSYHESTESNAIDYFKSSYYLNQIGFLFITAGLVSGAYWAKIAWTRYWNWDPKETWSLILWLIYAFYFHLEKTKLGAPKRMAYISVLGLIIILLCYLGVNVIFPQFTGKDMGLHSYGVIK